MFCKKKLCEKEYKNEDEKENPVVKQHCQLLGKFRGFAHNNCNLNTRKAHTSIVSKILNNYSGYDSQ